MRLHNSIKKRMRVRRYLPDLWDLDSHGRRVVKLSRIGTAAWRKAYYSVPMKAKQRARYANQIDKAVQLLQLSADGQMPAVRKLASAAATAARAGER